MNGTLASLRPAELRHLTEVDHHDHEAMVAIDTGTGRLIGVMRYIRITSRPEEAELAALVVDDRQRHGVATALLAELSTHALEDGIERFRAIVSPENTPATAALRRLGANRVSHDGEVHFLLPVVSTLLARR
jgi:RimJ/RimL family protein N-acetyltransferase